VGGDDLVVRSEGDDPVALHGDRAPRDGRRADRKDQWRGVNGQQGGLSWR
jgi:hypothetical protein